MPVDPYSGWLLADPPRAVGDQFDGWLRVAGPSGDVTFLEGTGGAKAATLAGAPAKLLVTQVGGALASARADDAGAAVSIAARGGSKAAASAADTGSTALIILRGGGKTLSSAGGMADVEGAVALEAILYSPTPPALVSFLLPLLVTDPAPLPSLKNEPILFRPFESSLRSLGEPSLASPMDPPALAAATGPSLTIRGEPILHLPREP